MATFIFLHGTFAKPANWPALQQSLETTAQMAGEAARFEHIVWSGKNRARRSSGGRFHDLQPRERSLDDIARGGRGFSWA